MSYGCFWDVLGLVQACVGDGLFLLVSSGYFRGALGMSHGCFKEFLWSLQAISKFPHRGFNVVSKVFHLFFKGFQGGFETFELSL